MRFLRGSAPPVRAIVTAGNLIGCIPRHLGNAERLLAQEHARRSFARVIEATGSYGANLVLIAGGLFAQSEPPLEDVRFVARILREVSDAGASVLALDESPDGGGGNATALAFLEDLGLLLSVPSNGVPATRTIDVSGISIAICSSGVTSNSDPWSSEAQLRIVLASDAGALDDPANTLGSTDLIVLGDSPEPGSHLLGSATVVRPGWSSPSGADNRVAAGFALAEFGTAGTVELEFREIDGGTPAVLLFKPEEFAGVDPATALRERVAPLIGDAPFITLEFTGLFSRELWHRCHIGDLRRRASSAGSIINIDLSRLEVPTASSTTKPTRSFLVEVRRAADRMDNSAEPRDTKAIDRARQAITARFQSPPSMGVT